MFEEFFAANKNKMDPERIIKFEKYKKEMFEEESNKKYKTFLEITKEKDVTWMDTPKRLQKRFAEKTIGKSWSLT